MCVEQLFVKTVIVNNNITIIKAKVKVLPITGHEGPEGEWRYSSTLS